jgi:O-methyltransferase
MDELSLPTRLILPVWGKDYVDEMLNVTVPALLAPGNLPSVAARVPCEFVILTQQIYFQSIETHPSITQAKKYCPVRLVKIDDLIAAKDKYGMTLTHSLFRGLSDLGPGVTDRWQIFLNADFIIADGSLRTLLSHLARGARIVAAPSYCTEAEKVLPALQARVDVATSELKISPRELAAAVLENRHSSIRGKTANFPFFHHRYLDQFYWDLGPTTLLGLQMPVSIVGLRPERFLAEPNTYWDFGLIKEFCPTSEILVLGDSDDFMMMELRDKAAVNEYLVLGERDVRESAALMKGWVTPYQRDFIRFPLTLHSEDIPSDATNAHRKLKAYTDEILAYAGSLPSHLRHPQWEYHKSGFRQTDAPAATAATLISNNESRIRSAISKRPRLKTALLKYARPVVNAVTGAQWFAKRPTETFKDAYIKLARTISFLRSPISEAEKTRLNNIATHYRFQLERAYDYQNLSMRDDIAAGMKNLEPEFIEFYNQCKEFTMTAWPRLYALYDSVKYIVERDIPGAIVECGVWRGGGMKLAAMTLLSLGATDRKLYLYDTFEGMTQPEEVDRDFHGNSAKHDWDQVQSHGVKWAYAPVEEVRQVMESTGYPMEQIVFVKGPVERTIPASMPERIALLRLDTDWHSSTKQEMEHLYPLLASGGVMALDDYGHYRGAQKAVDDYFALHGSRPLMYRIDYSCRFGVKI